MAPVQRFRLLLESYVMIPQDRAEVARVFRSHLIDVALGGAIITALQVMKGASSGSGRYAAAAPRHRWEPDLDQALDFFDDVVGDASLGGVHGGLFVGVVGSARRIPVLPTIISY